MKPQDENDMEEISRAAHDWRALMQSDAATAEDRRIFAQWLAADLRHEEAYDRAVTLWTAYDHLHADDIDRDLMQPLAVERWSNWVEHIAAFFAPSQYRLAGAALVIALCAAPIIWMVLPQDAPPTLTYATQTGETMTLTLGDGSRATLGAATEIETTMTAQRRKIRLLSGAALFEVQPDQNRPFSVYAGDLTATALGTVFDVRNNGGVSRVAVAEGAVRVSYPFVVDGKATHMSVARKLEAGEQVAAAIHEGLRETQSIQAGKVGAWRKAKLVYDGATLRELVADANRYDARGIILDDPSQTIAALKITASFSGDDIDGMLSMLSQALPVAIDQTDSGQVYIRPRGTEDP